MKKTGKDHEIIEIVNGFTIKRRKTDAAPLVQAENAQNMKTPYSVERASVASQRTPNVEEFEISQELYDRLSRSLHNLPETAPPSDRLLAVCSSVCRAEMDALTKSGKGGLAAMLDEVFTAYIASLSAAAEQGAIQFAEPASGGKPILDADDLKVDLEARKAGLKNRLQMLKKEEEEWNALLAKVEALEVAGPAEDNAADDDHPNTLAAEDIGSLRQAQQQVGRQLTMQVDGVCQLVGNIEDLVDRTNETTKEVHKQYHNQRFQAFLHFNSPVKLIRGIVGQPSPKASPSKEKAPH